jgi:hypothetical protein
MVPHWPEWTRVLVALFLRVRDNYVEENDENKRRIALRFKRRITRAFISVATIPRKIYIRYVEERLSIDSRNVEEGKIAAADYRFKSRDQLHRLMAGFQIPAFFITPNLGYRFSGEELFLIALERCALGSRYLDLQEKYHSAINFEFWGELFRGI